MKKFSFYISADVSLTEREIWPDGDATTEPTVADVVALIEKCGGKIAILRDWDLENDLSLEVMDDKDFQVVR